MIGWNGSWRKPLPRPGDGIVAGVLVSFATLEALRAVAAARAIGMASQEHPACRPDSTGTTGKSLHR